MNENILRQVQKKLNSKYYVTNNAWLRDCIEYYLSEHDNPNDNEVLEFVVSQWQLSDLREISNEVPCLPKNLDREKCTTLRGYFILQMEKVYDISESKFKQIEKIRNVSNDNIQVTEDEKTQGTWEPKKKRMLQLHLTDGDQNIVGIEYKPIRFLNDALLPGYKLLIKGPVTCRRGVILLDESCIEEIGGEVANLLVPNALENVLARALKLPENPDPYCDNEDAKKKDDELFIDDCDIDIDDVAVIESDEYRQSIATAPANERVNHDLPPEPAQNETPTASHLSKTESDLFFEEFDDVIMFDEAEIVDAHPKSDKRDNSGLNSASPYRQPEATVDRVRSPGNLNKINVSGATPSYTNEKNSRTIDLAATSKKIPTESRSSSNSSIDVGSSFCPTSKISTLIIDDDNRDKTIYSSGAKHCQDNSMKKPHETTANKRSAALLSPARNSPPEKMHCPKSGNATKAISNRKITEFMKSSAASSPVRSAPKIYDSVCDLLNIAEIDTVTYKTIKGKVTKFDKLSKNGQSWQLNATITDKTGSIDMNFSSKILESMLGFSVAEFSIKRKLKKTDPNMENYLRQGFRSAEKTLSELDGVMEIELAPNEKPKVVKIKDENDRR